MEGTLSAEVDVRCSNHVPMISEGVPSIYPDLVIISMAHDVRHSCNRADSVLAVLSKIILAKFLGCKHGDGAPASLQPIVFLTLQPL